MHCPSLVKLVVRVELSMLDNVPFVVAFIEVELSMPDDVALVVAFIEVELSMPDDVAFIEVELSMPDDVALVVVFIAVEFTSGISVALRRPLVVFSISAHSCRGQTSTTFIISASVQLSYSRVQFCIQPLDSSISLGSKTHPSRQSVNPPWQSFTPATLHVSL